MSQNKIIINAGGMHCRSCELLVEDELSEISNVERSVVNYKKGTVEVHYGENKPDMREVENAIRKAGYTIGGNNKKAWLSSDPEDYKDLGIAFIFLIGAYIVLKNLGIGNIGIGSTTNPSNLGVVFLVGITAGLSTCMALVGGLILGISARHSEIHPEASTLQKFRPHLFFNMGRIGGYALLGGILGSIGSGIQFSAGTLGLLTVIVGVVMLMLGLKLIGIFPKLENGGITLPKFVSRAFGISDHVKEYSHKGSMLTGVLTFFLPCGFTQAMQLYAISTGSFARGAMIMGVFALGTAPGLLGVGGLTSVVKGVFARRFFKFAGILVVFLAMFNISNGYNLSGVQLGTNANSKLANIAVNDPLAGQANVKMDGNVQVVSMTETSGGYAPSSFTIKKGVPVRWEIDAKDAYSCASSLMVSKLGIRKTLQAGKNVIEFIPTESGKLPFSCSMGMYTGVFNVVDDNGNNESVNGSNNTGATSSGTCGVASAPQTTNNNGPTTGGGGCGMMNRTPVQPTQGQVQNAPQAGQATVNTDANVQVINATYTYGNDIQPNTFKVKAGQPVKFIVDVKENGSGCMSTIMVQGLYNQPQLLQKGSKLEMDFTPTKPGVYSITCAMGVPRGTITVE